jgi:hypothetical protein
MLFNETFVLAGRDQKTTHFGWWARKATYLDVSMHAKAIVITITHFVINNTPSIRV